MRDGSVDDGFGGHPVWEHISRRANGDRQCERRCPLGLRRFVSGRIWNRPGGLVFQFEILFSRRDSIELADDLLRAFARLIGNTDLHGVRNTESAGDRTVPDRAWLVNLSR